MGLSGSPPGRRVRLLLVALTAALTIGAAGCRGRGAEELRGAAEANDPSAVRDAVSSGVSPNASVDNEPALCAAAAAGAESAVAELLRAGADPDRTDAIGRSPLRIAARSGNADCVRAILAAGADPNLADSSGDAPLNWAARFAGPDVVDELLKAGADANALGGTGCRPLQLAVGRPANVAALLRADADPNGASSSGTTALHEAAKEGSMDSCRLLVEAGANLAARASDGRTPGQCATDRAVAEYLAAEEARARPAAAR